LSGREAPYMRAQRPGASRGRVSSPDNDSLKPLASVPQFPDSRFDLGSPEGRKRARHDLMWVDHGFLRVMFQNFHWISPEMARANQPSPEHVDRYAAMGCKTIINLRGVNDSGQYHLEREACLKHGIALVDFPVRSRDVPTVEQIFRAKEIFETIQYPALMHCKSGADRAGLMAVLYKHFRLGLPIAEALEQLSLKYLHVRQGKTGMIDFFFDAYLADNAVTPITFEHWVREKYDYKTQREKFLGSWWANILVDKILRRE
jgi:protein tyrosine/serine phosphatase